MFFSCVLRVHGQSTDLLMTTGQSADVSNLGSEKERGDGRGQNWEESVKKSVELVLSLFYQVGSKMIVPAISTRYDVTFYVYHLRVVIKNKNETKNYWET